MPLRWLMPSLLIVLAVVLGLVNFRYSLNWATQHVEQDGIEHLTQMLTRHQSSLEFLLTKGHRERLQEEIATLTTDPTIDLALLVDPTDRVVGSMNRASIGSSLAEFMRNSALAHYGDYPHFVSQVKETNIGRVTNIAGKHSQLGAFPVSFGAEGAGALLVGRDLTRPLTAERAGVYRRTFQFALFTASAAVFAWLLFHVLLGRRVAQVVGVANALAAGNYGARSHLRGKDELMQLSRAFNHMASQIETSYVRLNDKESQLRQALAAADMGTWRWDVANDRIYWSERVWTMFGRDGPLERPTLASYLALVYAHDREQVRQVMLDAAASGRDVNFEHRVVWPDGSMHWVACRGEIASDQRRETSALTGLMWDVTALKTAQDALHQQKERAEVTLYSIADGVITTDAACRVEYMNPAAAQISGWSVADALGKPLHQIFRIRDGTTRELLLDPGSRCLTEGRMIGLSGRAVLIRPDSRELAIEESAAPMRDRVGHIIGAVVVFRDVSTARELADKLSWQASHDMLTGLVNRHRFEVALGEAIKSAHAKNQQHTLLYIDLDQFKVINDTCGHAAGDALLKQLSALMQDKMRGRDLLGRLGGDEFGALLELCTPDQAYRIADGLRQVIKDFRFVWEDKLFDLSASIGVVAINQESGTMEKVLAAADLACYAAKDRGRNRIHIYEPNDAELAGRHDEMMWVSRLKHALADNRLHLFYQPMLSLRDEPETREHIEILLRMVDEKGGEVRPASFIAAAERFNLMPAVDRWVIDEVLDQCARACRALAPDAAPLSSRVLLAVNLSGSSLNDETLFEFVQEKLHYHDVDPRVLCFEITETAAITHLGTARLLIEKTRRLGCSFALDDFGAGLSSFAYLKNLPVDYLKIDGMFVRTLHEDATHLAMVEAINRIGHVMGMRTIAEFVEHDSILQKLRDVGVDYAQGYAIAVPVQLRSHPLFAVPETEVARRRAR